MPRQAPTSPGTPSGSGTACADGRQQHSAAVPHGRPQAAFHSHTRSPTRAASTPAPTASIVPLPSLWGMTRAKGIGRRPPRLLTSEGLTPLHSMRTRTSPGPGSGTGRSARVSTSAAGPVRS